MTRHDLLLPGGAFLLALTALGCNPKIGDECSVSTDCSVTGDRLCDTTQPAGYCTIFNCEPGTCPDEAICVAFRTDPSPAPGCLDPQGGSRFERTFCMRKCADNSECRAGYECHDVNHPGNPWASVVVEKGDFDARVCIVPASGAPVPGDASTGVCTGYDGGFDGPPMSVDASSEDAALSADAADEDVLMSVDATDQDAPASSDAAGD